MQNTRCSLLSRAISVHHPPRPRRATLLQITVMFLYSEEARTTLGLISDSQMQTYLAEALTWTNEAMMNSEIDLRWSLAHVGPVSLGVFVLRLACPDQRRQHKPSHACRPSFCDAATLADFHRRWKR